MKKNLLFVALLSISGTLFSQSIDNSFFDQVMYRGAFGTTDWTSGWANFDPQNTVYASAQDTIDAGDITENKTAGSPAYAPASFSDDVLKDSFFTKVDYIGAFGQTDWTSGWANFDPQNTVYPDATVTISAGDITANTVWTNDNVYLLNGWVYVKDGATLTIEPGTIIRGDMTNKAALIVEKGGKLVAEGTASQPIVFT
ncbi:MAG: hypothetical protein H6Q14_1843, partial [Bacteroidetes bacterium]|nr:hypothetical protein [Bacteroidota bacterium]